MSEPTAAERPDGRQASLPGRTDTVEVKVPDIGDFSDVPVIELHVAAGDAIAPEDPIVTLESDKATMDVPSPIEGVVREVKVAIGDTVSEGTVILLAAPGGVDAEEAAASLAEPAVEDAEAVEDETPPPPAAGQPAAAAVDGVAPPGAILYAGPGARRLARELGVDLATVRGTGRKGRILKADVEQAAKAGPAAAPAGAGAAGGLQVAPWPVVDFERFGEVERVALSRIKRISGPVLHRNWVSIPHVTHNDEADITELEAFRKRTNDEIAKSGVKITMVALLLKAVVPALRRFPEVNASLDGDELVLKRYFHIGFAADTPQGLVVPVIRDVDTKGIVDIAAELMELSGKARDGKLGPSDMAGGTFTISSLGGIGGTSFTPIVNAPEVAILGVTRSATKPVWDGSQFVPRLMVPLSLSYDHRVIDGALAARFVTYLASVLSDLKRALL
jgi:pyruvate dehydrogenase E2 component (dihydrolipoamide acetyltransferase)